MGAHLEEKEPWRLPKDNRCEWRTVPDNGDSHPAHPIPQPVIFLLLNERSTLQGGSFGRQKAKAGPRQGELFREGSCGALGGTRLLFLPLCTQPCSFP